MITEATNHGFQEISSNHVATNNPIIIAKLKANFVITGITLSDLQGIIVTLSYYKNNLRKQALDYRVGAIKHSAEIEKIFKNKS